MHFIGSALFVVLVIAGLVWLISRQKKPPGINQGQLGDARKFNTDDYGPMGFLADDGHKGPQLSYISFAPDPRRKKEVSKFVTYPGDGHLLTVAPAGKGKSAGPVMCNLIAYPDSVVVTDVKGELATNTAAWRSIGLRQDVHVVDPWGIVDDTDLPSGNRRARFNPLDIVPGGWAEGPDGRMPIEGADSYDDARLVADALILQGSESDPFWDRTGKALLTGLILTVALDPGFTGPRTLGAVNDILSLPDVDFRKALAGIAAGPVAGAASEINRFLQLSERTASSVLGTIHSNMSFLQSSRMQETFSGSDFVWAEVKRNPTTVYLCIPPARLTTHSQFLRLMFITAIAGMEREPIPKTAPDGSKRQSVLFLMDEFANLGRLDRLLDAFALMRGYGLKFWAFVQDLNQLKGLYGDRWQTFIANAGVIQSFGTRDSFTAEELSKLTGQMTQEVPSISQNPQGESRSTSLTGRPLLYPHDFTSQDDNRQILIMESRVFHPPKTLWFKSWPYRRLVDFNQSRKSGGTPRIPRLGTSADIE